MTARTLPDPALVVLVGASGSGKSTWAATRYRDVEVVSSDALRAIVGSGPGDLDASDEAFDVLDRVVAARTRRGLTAVVDTLGLDPRRRAVWREQARAAGLPTIAVRFDTPAGVCRERNARRDRRVPARVLRDQLERAARAAAELDAEGWDAVVVVRPDDSGGPGSAEGATTAVGTGEGERSGGEGGGEGGGGQSGEGGSSASGGGGSGSGGGGILALAGSPVPRVVLQLSAFPWGADPATWLRDVALAADGLGFAGLALMDHLVQIPQVGRAWDPIPEPFVTLGLLAGLDTRLHLGTLVSPVTFRRPGVVAKAVATLDTLSGGRAFCGLGAGWWEREHATYGLAFPGPGARLDLLEEGVETLRALWATGTRPYAGRRVSLPETTSYPRPVHDVPLLVGGTGARTLAIAGTVADAANVPADEETMPGRIEAVRAAARAAGRADDAVAMTVLDVAVVGRDREDVATRVERLRGRTGAAAFARRHHAAVAVDHVERYRRLAGLGVRTVFLALPDLEGAADLERVAPLLAGLT